MKKTIGKIEQLPTTHIREVDDFVEFLIQKSNDVLITEGLQQMSSSCRSYDFLYNEPELYSVNDLKVRFT
jgi:hypothetical protein